MENNVTIVYVGGSDEIIEALTSDSRFSVEVISTAQAAMNYLNSGIKPDAVLCETNIPDGSAFIIYDYLRGLQRLDQVAFIVVAFEFSEDDFKRAFSIKIDDYYVTPLPDSDTLVSRIEFLKEHRNKSANPAQTKEKEVNYLMPVSKRIFDIIVASSVLLMLSPILLIAIIAIRLESKGKVYYTSKRVGREIFDFYRLRSMCASTYTDFQIDDLAGAQYTTTQKPAEIDFTIPCPFCAALPEGETCSPIIHTDNIMICEYWYIRQRKEFARIQSSFLKPPDYFRVTKVGKFIRNTNIDKFPQFINVLKGDMSIVGNHPLPLYEAELLTSDLFSKRFLAPAGIFALWQAETRRKGLITEEERRLLDNAYADHFTGDRYSLLYDLRIILVVLIKKIL
ncbi:MAG: sugar transferase [Bacteroidota bacterium]